MFINVWRFIILSENTLEYNILHSFSGVAHCSVVNKDDIDTITIFRTFRLLGHAKLPVSNSLKSKK